MSVWSTLQGTLQMVQGTLEQTIGDEQEATEKEVVDSATQLSSAPSITGPSVATGNDDDVTALRERLKLMESQNQLINDEYAKLLREKEEEIMRLRSEHGISADQSNEDLVIELKKQLEEKERENKELNVKAESKFTKLKAQAKSKIAALQEELQMLKTEQSVNLSANTSQDSLNLSIQSSEETLLSNEISKLTQHLQATEQQLQDREKEVKEIKQLLTVQNMELESKNNELLSQSEELESLRTELIKTKEEHKVENDEVKLAISRLQDQERNLLERVSDLTNKLTNSENTIRGQSKRLDEYNIEIIQLKDTLKTQTDTLEQESALLQSQLEKEREQKANLIQQLSELSHPHEDEKRMTRDLSFASSEFQIVSQGDSEEEWKLIRASESGSGGSSEGKETSPPPEIISLHSTREDSPLTKTMHYISDIEKLKSSVTELEGSIVSKNNEISALSDQVIQLNEQLSLKNDKVVSLEEELRKKEWEGGGASWGGFDDIDNGEVERLSTEVQSLQGKLEELNENLEQKSDSLSRAREENEQYLILVTELRGELGKKESELMECKEKVLPEMADTVERLREEVNSKTTEVYRLECERDGLVLQVKESVEKSKVRERELVGEKELMEQELSKLSEENQQLRTRVRVLEDEKTRQIMEAEEKVKSVSIECESKVSSVSEESDKVIRKLQEDKDKVEQELAACRLEVKALEEWKQLETTEKGSLREELKRMSVSNETYSNDSAKCREELLTMEREVKRLRREKEQFAAEVDTVRETNKLIEKQAKEGKMRGTELEEELQKYKQETNRLKIQFDSAVDLLQQENSQLKSDLSSCKSECTHHIGVCEALQEQVKTEGKRSMELKDINKGLHHEVSSLNDRCLRLEREKAGIDHRMLELQRDHEQLQISLETALNDKESLAEENHTSRRNNEVYEKHVLELTNQITLLVREKDVADENVRKLQRDVIVKEKEVETIKEELEMVLRDSREREQWTSERQVLLDTQTKFQSELQSITKDNREKELEIDRLKDTIEGLQTQHKTLQDTLINAQDAMTESSKKESNKISDIEMRMADISHAHNLELSHFKSSLEEEQQRRTIAENKLNELQLQREQQQKHEDHLSIEIEEDNNNEMGGVNNISEAVKKWIRRFIKNPNIVLVRLVRATPQTQLFFIGYLILVHLILLIMFVS